jgi:hypothetical protein
LEPCMHAFLPLIFRRGQSGQLKYPLYRHFIRPLEFSFKILSILTNTHRVRRCSALCRNQSTKKVNQRRCKCAIQYNGEHILPIFFLIWLCYITSTTTNETPLFLSLSFFFCKAGGY